MSTSFDKLGKLNLLEGWPPLVRLVFLILLLAQAGAQCAVGFAIFHLKIATKHAWANVTN